MHGFDWDDVRVFLAIVESGSVSAAASALDINQSTVSRRVAALEQRLAVPLFERNRGNRWVLTAAGERMVSAAALMQDSANTIAREVLRNATEVSGHVTVTFTDHGSRYILLPALAALAREYPELRLTFAISSDPLDLAAREADVAVRFADEVPENVVARRVSSVAVALFATEDIRAKVENGEKVPLICWHDDGKIVEWMQAQIPNSVVAYRANRPGAISEFARLGAGVATLSLLEGLSVPGLVALEGTTVLREEGIWVITHTDLRTTARVRMVRDRLIAALEAARPQLEGPFHQA